MSHQKDVDHDFCSTWMPCNGPTPLSAKCPAFAVEPKTSEAGRWACHFILNKVCQGGESVRWRQTDQPYWLQQYSAWGIGCGRARDLARTCTHAYLRSQDAPGGRVEIAYPLNFLCNVCRVSLRKQQEQLPIDHFACKLFKAILANTSKEPLIPTKKYPTSARSGPSLLLGAGSSKICHRNRWLSKNHSNERHEQIPFFSRHASITCTWEDGGFRGDWS